MIALLLKMQFGLLFLPAMMLSLVVYGSDFKETSGYLYLGSLIVIPLLHWRLKHKKHPWALLVLKIVIALGVLAGVLLSRLLYFNVWDEHSIIQAALVAVLALCSYLAAFFAHAIWPGGYQQKELALVLVLIAVVYLLAVYFPFVAFLALVVIFIWAIPFSNRSQVADMHNNFKGGQGIHNSLLQFLFFVLSMDLFLVVWDFQVNSHWGFLLGLSFLAAAAGSYLFKFNNPLIIKVLVGLSILQLLLSEFWPQYFLNPVHAIFVGGLWGFTFTVLLSYENRLHLVNWVLLLFLAMLFGYAFYANLAYISFRMTLLLPLLLAFLPKQFLTRIASK